MKIKLSTFQFLILIFLFVTVSSAFSVAEVRNTQNKPAVKNMEYRQFHEPAEDYSSQKDADSDTGTEEEYYSDTSTALSNTSEVPPTPPQPSSSINEPTAREGLRSSLRYMQQVLLSLAGITFVFIVLYSAYYIHLLRQVYGKERVAE